MIRPVESPLSKRILAGEFAEGDTARVEIEGGEFAFKAGAEQGAWWGSEQHWAFD